ncbi:MAG TPA: aminopeptidase N [Propionibacteriaceae bacterium]
MPAPADHTSLLRTEARQREQDVSVTQMLVELDLTLSETIFVSSTTITFDSTPGADTFVDFKGDQLLSATLNGNALPASCWSRGRIALAGLESHNVLVVKGLMAYSRDGEGLHRHVDPADGRVYLYAMSFLDAAPRWFACFDQPDLKSPYELRVTARPQWTVIGNGPSTSIWAGHWRIVSDTPLSTYFVTLVAGDYVSVRDEHDGIRLGFHARAALADALQAEAADLVSVTTSAFDYFHRVFGVRYPFGEYHQAFVPELNAGAMENPGCVTLRDQYIFRSRATRSERAHRAGTMVHEMAHMWFGDLVTMRWWDDLWLNESFAEYMAHRACEEATPYSLWTEFGILRKDWGSIADQGPSTHPVAGVGAPDAAAALQDFDGISYAKGAAVLKQLVAYVSDEVFFAGLRRYFAAHAFGNAEFDDLMRCWTETGARDLGSWASSWLRTSGMDTIDVVPAHGAAVLTRTPPQGQDVTRTHALQVGAVDQDGRLFARTGIQLAGEPVGVEVPEDVALLIPDVGDDTWAKIRFGPGGWDLLRAVLPQLGDPVGRVVLYNSLRDGVRDAEVDPAAALEVICRAAVTERSEVVLGSVLEFAQGQLAGPFSPPRLRAGRRAQVCAAARSVVDSSPPGSDHQLAAFRRLILSCDDPDLQRGWLGSAGLPGGIELDPELRWSIVTRLTALTADERWVEDGLRQDHSGLARSYAARARAQLPLPEAKERAWQLLMRPSGMGAYEVYSTAEGFFHPAQTTVTAPYVQRYFSDIVETSTFRSGWALGRVATLAFPAEAATQHTLDLANATLARDDLLPSLQRKLRDRTDALRRAVASVARWGQQ